LIRFLEDADGFVSAILRKIEVTSGWKADQQQLSTTPSRPSAVLDRQAGGREKIEATGVPVVTLVTAGELGLA
jgi:orotate phosphoribosyltransferase